MFDFKNLGDMAKIAGQAREMQKQQDRKQQEQLNVLNRIAGTLDEILSELKKNA